jgi:Tfp pilus assembly protein PilX
MNMNVKGSGRRGAIAVVALVCMAVAAVVMVVAVRRALGEWKMVRLEAQQVQCRWLAESALDRATARLAADPKYAGEVWKIAARTLRGKEDGGKGDKGAGGAQVKIDVSTPPNEPSRRVVRVQADWPEDAPERVRVSKQATIELSPAKGK